MATEPQTTTPAPDRTSPVLIMMPGRRTAVCPNCVNILNPSTIQFIHGYAFCTDCVADDNPTLWELIAIMKRASFMEHRITRYGLTFYTPRSEPARDVYAQRAHDRAHAPIG